MTNTGCPDVPSPIPLSVLIRTKNEADRLPVCLAAARRLGGEIVVIDAGSTDATIAIAQAAGARVLSHAWEGYGPQRRFGEERCRFDHILSLDADEIVTDAFAREVRALFASGPPPRLARVRKALIPPHWRHPPPLGFCHEQILLYDRRIARTAPLPQWDKLEIDGDKRPSRLRAPLWHFSFRDWDHARAKAEAVARLAAESLSPRPIGRLRLRLAVEFPLAFFKFYFLRRYALAGRDGFRLAVLSARGRRLRIALMLERSRALRKPFTNG